MVASKKSALDLHVSSPNIDRLNAIYAKELKRLGELHAKIEERLQGPKLDEIDGVRLSKTAQLIELYRPDREVKEKRPNAVQIFGRRMVALFNYRSERKRKESEVHRRDNAYLLAEDAVLSLRKLRKLDAQIKQHAPAIDDRIILDQSFGGEPQSRSTVETSLTLSYEKKNWGVERICLDGVQNHLPSDSGGSRVWVQCLVENQWLSIEQARDHKTDIKAVRFVDDGVGFDSRNLSLLWSTKAEEEGSRGQFGEGMKMIAATAVREGVGMVLESQNWRAIPRAQPLSVENTRKGQHESVEQLVFDIDYFDKQSSMRGSRTTFTAPTPAFIDEVLKLDHKVLDLNTGYRPIMVSEHGTIVSTSPGTIYVKGIKVSNENTLFSYDFSDVETNRDRNQLINFNIDRRIVTMLNEVSDKRIIKHLLQRSVIADHYDVHHEAKENAGYYGLQSKYPGIWQQAFEECFGKDTCIDTGFEFPSVIDTSNIRRIRFAAGVSNQLRMAGVKTDKQAIPDFHSERMQTSLTLGYGEDVWSEQRIFLDSVQNHLPRDSGGNNVNIQFKSGLGVWHDFVEFPKFADDQITAVKISDNGRGYDNRLLGLFGSTKTGDSSGKFGEGLKMLSAASVRANVPVVLRSRDWMAIPVTTDVDIDGKTFKRLDFDITRELKQDALERHFPKYLGDNYASSTLFLNPSPALLAEFRRADENVLALRPYKPLESTSAGEILTLDGGKLYVRDILIPAAHDLHYSYHLSGFDIQARDRNFISRRELMAAVGNVWTHVRNEALIRDYLLQASRMAADGYPSVEFEARFWPATSFNENLWVETFRKVFGSETALRSSDDQDFNVVHQNQHLGLKTVSMPPSVYIMLSQCRDKNGKHIITLNEAMQEANKIEIIPDDKLTVTELTTLNFLREVIYPIVVPDRAPGGIVAFEPRGRVQARGLSGEPLKINRIALTSIEEASDVFVHEITHNETGAADADSGFRNFLTRGWSRYILHVVNAAKEAQPQPRMPSSEALRGDIPPPPSVR